MPYTLEVDYLLENYEDLSVNHIKVTQEFILYKINEIKKILKDCPELQGDKYEADKSKFASKDDFRVANLLVDQQHNLEVQNFWLTHILKDYQVYETSNNRLEKNQCVSKIADYKEAFAKSYEKYREEYLDKIKPQNRDDGEPPRARLYCYAPNPAVVQSKRYNMAIQHARDCALEAQRLDHEEACRKEAASREKSPCRSYARK